MAGTLYHAGSLSLAGASRVTANFTSTNGVEVFVFCAPFSSSDPFEPPESGSMAGYIFSSGAATSLSIDVTLPAGRYYMVVIDPGIAASAITLTGGVDIATAST